LKNTEDAGENKMSNYLRSFSGDDTELTEEEVAQVAREQMEAARLAAEDAALQAGSALGSPLPLILIGAAVWYFFIKK